MRNAVVVKLLLHVAMCLVFADGTLVGIIQNTSAPAGYFTRCHVSLAMGTLDVALELQTFECFDIALFLMTFLARSLMGVKIIPSSASIHVF